MSAKRTRSIQTTIHSSNNTVKVINIVTDVYDDCNISDVMESIKCSINDIYDLNSNGKDVNVSLHDSKISNIDDYTSDSPDHDHRAIACNSIEDTKLPSNLTNDIDVDELFTKMLTDLINNMPDNRKFIGISELTQAINEIISNSTSPDKYSFKISNMLLSMDPYYIKSIKEIFKSDVSSKMINIIFPLSNNDTFIKCRCRRNVDGLKDKWVIKFK